MSCLRASYNEITYEGTDRKLVNYYIILKMNYIIRCQNSVNIIKKPPGIISEGLTFK